MFLVQLINLPDVNVYKRITYHILAAIGPQCPEVSKSPIKEMYRAAWKYGMGIDIWNTLIFGNNVSLNVQKNECKRAVWKKEKLDWRATCIMYGSKIIYFNELRTIRVISWWKFAQANPRKLKQVCATVALLSGTQPKGLQHNFGQSSCMLCENYTRDSPVHILFECVALQTTRHEGFESIRILMPGAMLNEFEVMSVQVKCLFFLLC